MVALSRNIIANEIRGFRSAPSEFAGDWTIFSHATASVFRHEIDRVSERA
jgi:hypothetical protein